MKLNIKHYLFTGLLSILPITATYWIVLKLFNFFSNPGYKLVEFIFSEKIPKYIPQITGFLLTILFIYIVGLFVSNVLGKKVYALIENMLSRIPIINSVYYTIKQILSTISSPNKQSFKKVVYIEYPRKGLWTLTMVTGASIDKKGKEYYHIFVPTTPNPTSGFMLYVPKSNAIDAEITIEEGLKIIISGGLLAPEKNNI